MDYIKGANLLNPESKAAQNLALKAVIFILIVLLVGIST